MVVLFVQCYARSEFLKWVGFFRCLITGKQFYPSILLSFIYLFVSVFVHASVRAYRARVFKKKKYRHMHVQ